MSNALKIVVGEEDEVILNRLCELIKLHYESEVLLSSDGLNTYDLILTHEPELVILSSESSKMSGLEIARLCQKKNISSKLILLLDHPEINQADIKSLDIKGFILKSCVEREIIKCINSILGGSNYVSDVLSKNGLLQIDFHHKLEQLTPSETKILKLIARNYTTPEIANQLYVSQKTIEKHRSNISKKLKLSGKTNSLLLWVKENIKNLDI